MTNQRIMRNNSFPGMNQGLPQQRANQSSGKGMQYTKIAPPMGNSLPANIQKSGGGIMPSQANIPGGGLLPVSVNGNQRSLYVQVQIGSVQDSYDFPDVQTLLGKRIIFIESFSDGQVSYSPNGKAGLPAAAQAAMTIQLNDATNTALMDHHPLVDFNPQLNNGLIRYMDYTNIIWTNCKLYLPLAAAGTLPATPYSALFMIGYLDQG